MVDDSSDTGLVSRVADWRSTRRSFVAGVGSAAGVGAFAGTGAAQLGGGPEHSGAMFHVSRGNGQYRVTDGSGVVYRTTADRNAEEAFQYAFDAVPDHGGTVVASADTFRFGAPATLGDDTALTGQRGTRFVTSQIGRRDDPLPSDEQENPLPRGHDLIRVRGDNAAVTNVEFDGAGTQLDSHAVQADDCTGVLIANNRTVNGFQMALSFTGCTNVAVRGNEVVDPNWYGITSRGAPEGSERDLKRSTDVVVAENRVSGMKFNNIATYNVNNFSIVGNVVFDGGHSLIACSPAQQGAIVGNVCRDLHKFGGDPGGEAGIEIEYKETHLSEAVAGTPEATSYDITVSGNQIAGCEVGFIARTVPADAEDTAAREQRRPYSFTVTGNAINDCAAAGVRIRSGESGVIATNTIRNADTAIDVDEEFTEDIRRELNVTRG